MEPRINPMANPVGGKIAKRFYGINLLIEESSLPKSIQELVSLRASQINGCAACIDMHTKEAVAAGETPLRLYQVAAWRESAVFTEAERAALALTEEGTRLADAHGGVSDEVWERAAKHFDEDQLIVLVSLISMINAANRLNVMLGVKGGSYDPSMRKALEN
ncbi:carboxymuconolactone decarboxylase family protein [Dactylosporangium salmoneum]|uniref:Carboxymuconolactone decarboxylase family protein n=1 Tax=Dactylosporangium salmoneum TaxID=53361 RepID=A0ABN3I107_9ACTN